MKGSLPDYTLIRSNRCSMVIQVRPGAQVIVRAPQDVSDERVRRFVQQHLEAIRRHMQAMALIPPQRLLSGEEVKRLRANAQAFLPEKVTHYARLLGQKISKVTITSAQKRFGSCSSKGSLCFSYMLMRYPESAIDYVVLHEVAHLIHHNHSPAFYQTIARHMPDFHAREALLKQAPVQA